MEEISELKQKEKSKIEEEVKIKKIGEKKEEITEKKIYHRIGFWKNTLKPSPIIKLSNKIDLPLLEFPKEIEISIQKPSILPIKPHPIISIPNLEVQKEFQIFLEKPKILKIQPNERIELPSLSLGKEFLIDIEKPKLLKIELPNILEIPIVSFSLISDSKVGLEPIPKVKDKKLEEMKEEKEVVSEIEKEKTIEEIGEGGEDNGDYNIFFELFLEIIKGEKKIGKFFTNRPKCLILPKIPNESFHSTIQILCRELYREKKGGLPKPQTKSEERIKQLGDEIYPENKIVLIEIEKNEERKIIVHLDINSQNITLEEGELEKWLKKQLKNFFSQEYGFLLLSIDENIEGKFTEGYYNYIKEEIEPKIDVFLMKIKNLNNEEKKKISQLVWGFVDIEGKNTFDSYFTEGEQKYKEELEKFYQDEEIVYHTNRHKGSEESEDIHYPIKLFVVQYLNKKKKIQLEEIYTEEEINENIIPDIYFFTNGEKTIIEVETLFGGGIPIKNIDDTVKKYKNEENIKEIWIILKNLDILFYFSDIKYREKAYKKEGKNVKFFTLDFKNKNLIEIGEIEKHLKKLKKQIKEKENLKGDMYEFM